MSVSELTEAIKLDLEQKFSFVYLQGEVSNCKLQSSGHLYFSLKDSGAQIGAVMFRLDVATLAKQPKDGDHVTVRGAINVYPPSGKYQLVVRELQFVGLGALLLKLEELKIKLQKRGFFRREHKKALPKFPKKIGVVTSPTGAAIQDVLNILTRRFKGFHLILNPVKVQGEGAAQEIAEAIRFFNQYNLVDVIIVGRGGGSIEDLWAFNEEIVAESIFASRIPIISAVGHETDHCIADYVADVRAPTPSAAAEIVIAEREAQLKTLQQLQRGLQQTAQHLLRHARQRLNSIAKHPKIQSPYAVLGLVMQRLDELRSLIDRKMSEVIVRLNLKLESKIHQKEALKPLKQIQHLKQKFNYLEKDLNNSWKKIFDAKKNRLSQIVHLLQVIDPKNVLAKGYSIVFSEKRDLIINSIHDLKKDQKVQILLADGGAMSTINEVFPSE